MSPPAASDRGAETRRRLVEATVRVGVRSGWGGITTRAVAAEAGLNQALLHYHFGSVDGVRRAAVGQVTAALIEASVPEPGHGAGVAATVGEVVAALAVADPDDEGSRFLFEAFLAAGRDPQLRAELGAVLTRARIRIAAWVTSVLPGATDGEVEGIAALIAAAFDGIYLHRLLDPGIDASILAAPIGRLVSGAAQPPGPDGEAAGGSGR